MNNVWIDLTPEMRAEVEYEGAELRLAVDGDEDRLPARLIGRIYIAAQAIRDAE